MAATGPNPGTGAEQTVPHLLCAPTINHISQAPDGSLWLGSGEGLYRFDGFTFERVRAIDGDSPAPTEVYTLLATASGSAAVNGSAPVSIWYKVTPNE